MGLGGGLWAKWGNGGLGYKKSPTGRNFCLRGWGGTSVAVEKNFFTSWGIFLPPHGYM